MPSNLRLTIVDHDGKVLYDNSLDKEQEIENHLQRPEIQTALIQKTGTAIRLSKSTGVEYYYFAKDYMNYFADSSHLNDNGARAYTEIVAADIKCKLKTLRLTSDRFL